MAARTKSGRFKKKTRRRRKATGTRKKTARRTPRRRRTTRRAAPVARKRTTTRRRRRSSPRRGGLVNMDLIKTGAGFAVGGIGAEFALRKLPLPAAFTASPTSQGLTAIGLGMLTAIAGKKLIGSKFATAIGAGMVGNGITRMLAPAVGLADLGGDDVYGYEGLPTLGELMEMPDCDCESELAGYLAGGSGFADGVSERLDRLTA